MIYDREDTYQWAEKLMAGDDSAIEVLAERYIHLVLNLSTTEIEKYPELYTPSEREDVVAEANFALIKALNTLLNNKKLKESWHISNYLKQEITNKLIRLRERLHIIRVPLATMRRKQREGNPVSVPTRTPGCVSELQLNTTANNYYPSVIDEVDLEPIEREILEQRLMNKATLTELSKHYNMSSYKIKVIYTRALGKVRAVIEGDYYGTP